jgi:hypothetical protein
MGELYRALRDIADRRSLCVALIAADENITYRSLCSAVDGFPLMNCA